MPGSRIKARGGRHAGTMEQQDQPRIIPQTADSTRRRPAPSRSTHASAAMFWLALAGAGVYRKFVAAALVDRQRLGDVGASL
jgi:hypothetical protein